MSKWCNEISDFCNYKRETVAIAMNCLDRFMSTPSGQEILLDRNLYQLAAMTALYSSVKCHEQEVMDPNLVSTLSRGVHAPKVVERMEATMLRALQWRVNPPTAMSFVRIIVNELIPDHILSKSEKSTITEIAKFQLEMTVNEYDFSVYNASSMALASLLNAMESCSDDGMFLSNFESTMRNTLSIDKNTTRDLRMAIYELLHGNEAGDCSNETNDDATMTNENDNFNAATFKSSGIHNSPRTVATSVRKHS
jgi:hypothetical protein